MLSRPTRAARAGLGLILCLPTVVAAHGFGRLYNLPVPFWLYAWGATAVLVVSFLIALYFVAVPTVGSMRPARDLTGTVWARGLRRARPVLQGFSVALLLLTIATALVGNRDPYRNFSMTFFWVVIVLGLTYVTALIGNVYAVLNPWRGLAAALGRGWPEFVRGRVTYHERLGDWPALVLLLGFIWFELFGRGVPRQLGGLLLAYTGINVLGVWLVGVRAWFGHCEFFSVYFRHIGRMAPLAFRRGNGGQPSRLLGRTPLSGLVDERPERLSTVVFIMAMLSTTAFDGLRATQFWVRLFWNDPTGWVEQLIGTRPIENILLARQWYIGWETLCLIASPFIYFGVYMLCIAVARALTRSDRGLRDLALDFAYPLLPIALVYHMTHYATLLLTQGLKIVSLLSDPFGWGWNLFGTAMKLRAPFLPDMAWVWHTQVALILIGHVLGVYVSHRVAVRVFRSRRDAAVSQLALLVLMVMLTIAGLWIIAQPLTVERMT
ncbi:hypothetical protein [uncultured Abyssibacter sp.]|uniref:hypothetical protein n=1 Tax=uncultured Abyssibacter sp. TaxID=2320202 RepID=UPI0032B11F05